MVSLNSKYFENHDEYVAFLLNCRDTTIKNIHALSARVVLTTDENERSDLNLSILKLEGFKAKTQAEITTCFAEDTTITPPSEEDTRKISSLVKQLDSLVANKDTAKAILDIATQLLKIWIEIKG
jgi:hypothetical protein